MDLKALAVFVSICVLSLSGTDEVESPKSVPPLIGMARFVPSDAGTDSSQWHVKLVVPVIRWKVEGEIVPKKRWPELETNVKNTDLVLSVGGPSPLSESRFVSVKGEELTREDVARRLAKETPVLISVNGKMPEQFYLQLTNPDAVVVILGARDGYPAPELLPAQWN